MQEAKDKAASIKKAILQNFIVFFLIIVVNPFEIAKSDSKDTT
jgi:hypothetical protein